jgi:hypothetical protein
MDNSNVNVAVANRTTVRYVIERMCLDVGKATYLNCDMLKLDVDPGTTVHDDSITLPPYPFYRVTIRVDGPRTPHRSYRRCCGKGRTGRIKHAVPTGSSSVRRWLARCLRC